MPATSTMPKLIGERLVRRGLITKEQLKTAIQKQQLNGRLLGEVMIQEGFLTETQVIDALSDQLGISCVDLASYEIDKEVVSLFSENFLREHAALPIFKIDQVVTVAMVDPLDVRTIDRLRSMGKCEIEPVFALPSLIVKTLDKYFKGGGSLKGVLQDIEASHAKSDGGHAKQTRKKSKTTHTSDLEDEVDAEAEANKAAVVKLVDAVLQQAVESRASDIHLEPDEGAFHLRYRVDGVLVDVDPPPENMAAAIVSRLKVMAGLDIAERRLPQDGRMQLTLRNQSVDFRVSTFPTMGGENVVIRVLDKTGGELALDQVGFLPEVLGRFQSLIERPTGIVLVTGPTGSGKTTTLYAGLRTVDAVKRNVITLEDPVEYRIPRIRQSQIDVKAGLTFAAGLRSIVRQDPDVIMVGEIRDRETAEIAIHAALTGHLVFSTLHTNDAAGALTRLIDMGVEPFLVASSVVGVLAQRLVRKLCPDCKKPYRPDGSVLQALGVDSLPRGATVFQAKGCEECNQTGYRGRVGLFELLEMTEGTRTLAIRKSVSSEIKAQAIKDGMTSLRQAGLEKVCEGVTTVEEVLQITE